MNPFTVLVFGYAILISTGNGAILTTTADLSADSTATTTTTTPTNSAIELSRRNYEDDPNIVLNGLYSECVFSFSFSCLQRKTLLFIERMGRSTVYPLIGDFITLVRTEPINRPELSEDKLRYLHGDELGDMVDTAVTDFFQNHVFRLKIPQWIDGTTDPRADNSLDFFIGDKDIEEGRKKMGGGGGKKGMKKGMMMMCMMMAGKAMMLAPLLLGLTKLAAIKAIILSFISLTISKIIILKKLRSQKGGGGGGGHHHHGGWSSGGGGGGGGWSSGGGSSGGGWQSSGGGWDRSFSNHDLAYRGHVGKS